MDKKLNKYLVSYDFNYRDPEWDGGDWAPDGGMTSVEARSQEEAKKKVIDEVVDDYEGFEVDKSSFVFAIREDC